MIMRRDIFSIACQLALIVSTIEAYRYYGICKTPSNENGICVHLVNCEPVYAMVYSVNETQQNYARESQCGQFPTSDIKQHVLVCCSLTPSPRRGKKLNLLPNTTECGQFDSNRVVGGKLTEIYEYPWTVLVQSYNVHNRTQMDFRCSGSLISSRYVLTAAHCLHETKFKVHSVRLGEWQLDTNPDYENGMSHIDLEIERAIEHPRFILGNGNKIHDIALLRMNCSVPLNKHIKPICLPTGNEVFIGELLNGNSPVKIAGWGDTGSGNLNNIKSDIEIYTWNVSRCQQVYQPLGLSINNTTQICAGGKEGVDSCFGDSGSGLTHEGRIERGLIRYWLVGIVSYGHKDCGKKDFPAVHTFIGPYIDWIKNTMEL